MQSVATSVRISADANQVLIRLAKKLGRSKSGIVEEALSILEQKAFAEEVSRAYAELKQDSEAWSEYMAEVAIWDKLASDGLPEGESW